MKTLKAFVVAFLTLGITSAYAQQVQVHLKNKKVYVNNQPYGYLHKSGSVWAKDFVFQNTKNEDVATITAVNRELANGYDYTYYHITFKATGQVAEMDLTDDFERRLANELAGYKVLKNDLPNPEGIAKFLERYPTTISKRLAANGGTYLKPETVEKTEKAEK